MVVSLIDAFTRHQIYLEGYKDHLDDGLDPILSGIRRDVSNALSRTNVATVSELTRRQLSKLISTINTAQARHNTKYRAAILKELKEFAQADAQLNRQVMETIEDKSIEQAYKDKDGYPVLGLLALRRNRAGRQRLWALVAHTPDPASGSSPVKLISQYLSFLRREVRAIIVRGHANGWSIPRVTNEIFGTKKNRYRDGFMARAKRNGASVIRTVVQHISSVVQAGVASVFYKFYEWVSVLDKGTTEICRRRDGRKYKYRKGPLPPAHFRCRSRAVPIKRNANYATTPDAFHPWLVLQPPSVQNDMVGKVTAAGVRSGKITATTLGRFRAHKRLTQSQFLSKLTQITTTNQR